MRHGIVDSIIEYKPDIPKVIERGILKLFKVDALSELAADEKFAVSKKIINLFSNTSATNYSGVFREYTLYYLPVNLYKIWRPLLDLVLTDNLPPVCSVLEMGIGPGSATFGLIEFYKYLAIDNYTVQFELDLTLVESSPEFLDVFSVLFENYRATIPENLTIKIRCVNSDAAIFLDDNLERYQLIVESNMFNPNEHIAQKEVENLAKNIKRAMTNNASAIFIEPAKKSLTSMLKLLKVALLKNGLHSYSPCYCNNDDCSQFASARLDVSAISIYNELLSEGIITPSQMTHAFEYAVFRNDTMRKYNYNGDGITLRCLDFREGELIRFKAFILTNVDNGDSFGIKICDGSRCGSEDVWINVPKSRLVDREVNCLTAGRGGLIDVKDAIVLDKRRIGLCQKTRLKIYL